jgi:hypothetical protein
MINSEVLNKIYDLRYQIEVIRDFDEIEISPVILSKTTRGYLYYNFVKKRITTQFNFGECVRISNKINDYLSKNGIKEIITKFAKSGVGKVSYSVNLEEEFAFRSMENGIIPPQLLPDEIVRERLTKHLLGLSSSRRGKQVPFFFYYLSTKKYWKMMVEIVSDNLARFKPNLSTVIDKGQDHLFILLVLILNNFIKVEEIQTEENRELLNQTVNLILDTLVPERISNFPEFDIYNCSSDLQELLDNEEEKHYLGVTNSEKFIGAVKELIQNKSGFDSELLSKLETEYHNYLK